MVLGICSSPLTIQWASNKRLLMLSRIWNLRFWWIQLQCLFLAESVAFLTWGKEMERAWCFLNKHHLYIVAPWPYQPIIRLKIKKFKLKGADCRSLLKWLLIYEKVSRKLLTCKGETFFLPVFAIIYSGSDDFFD